MEGRRDMINEVEKKPNKAAILFPCQPLHWFNVDRRLRYFLGWLYLVAFSCSFFVVPIACVIFALPIVWKTYPYGAATSLLLLLGSTRLPLREWIWARTLGELWYEIFDIHTNMTEQLKQQFVDGEQKGIHYIIAMHPHGVIPFQGLIWAAFCNTYLRDGTGRSLYGFGAVADVVLSLPILRTLMGWLACGGAGYETLKKGLVQGICESTNAVGGRKPLHLFILPGGIAEIFVSTPGEHKIVFKKRKGLIKLAIETGSSLIPCYVFGGTDFFCNLITGDNFLAKWSRKLRVSFTMFYGRFFLPIPFTPKVTMVFANPLPIVKWDVKNGKIPQTMVDDLHNQYLQSILDLFNKYKEAAGYPQAELEIV